MNLVKDVIYNAYKHKKIGWIPIVKYNEDKSIVTWPGFSPDEKDNETIERSYSFVIINLIIDNKDYCNDKVEYNIIGELFSRKYLEDEE